MSGQGSKQKILICAREVFYRAGYHAASLDDILRGCGVAKSNFYYHFRSKEALADAVLELEMQEMEQLLIASLRNQAVEPSERLKRFCERICYIQVESRRQGGCPFGNFAAGLCGDDASSERFRARLCEAFRQIEATLGECLRDGIERGQFRADFPPAALAHFAVAALEGLLLLTKTQRDSATLEGGLATMRRLLLPITPDDQNN